MRGTIDCFLPCGDYASVENLLRQLCGSRMIGHINLLVTRAFAMANAVPEGCSFIVVDGLHSASAMRAIAESVTADYAMLFLKDVPVSLGQYAILRMIRASVDITWRNLYHSSVSVQRHEIRSGVYLDSGPVLECHSVSLDDKG